MKMRQFMLVCLGLAFFSAIAVDKGSLQEENKERLLNILAQDFAMHRPFFKDKAIELASSAYGKDAPDFMRKVYSHIFDEKYVPRDVYREAEDKYGKELGKILKEFAGITLKARDGSTTTIPEKSAMYSVTLKEMIEEPGINLGKPMPLSEIQNGKQLVWIAQLLATRDPEIIYDNIDLSLREKIELLMIANYLNIPVLPEFIRGLVKELDAGKWFSLLGTKFDIMPRVSRRELKKKDPQLAKQLQETPAVAIPSELKSMIITIYNKDTKGNLEARMKPAPPKWGF